MLCFKRNYFSTIKQLILSLQNYSNLILKLNANKLLLGLQPVTEFIIYKMSFRPQRGVFPVCLSPLTTPHTQSHAHVLSSSIADKRFFFRVESPVAECELSKIMMTMCGVEICLHHEI